jgi:hypothetical protein
LYLPHAHGSDPDCKGSSRTLEKKLRFAYYRYGKQYEKQIILFTGFIIVGLVLKASIAGLSGSMTWSTSKHHPFKSMARPAKSAKPKTPSKIYAIPDSMNMLGDKSDFYAQLRKSFDMLYPTNEKRSREVVEGLRKYDIQAFHSMDLVDKTKYYDIYNCPDTPPAGYPFDWKLLEILNHWPSDAEVPFIVKGDPEVAKAVERWNTEEYLEALLGRVEHDTEYSVTNHFLYWTKEGVKPSDWKQPTKRMEMTYKEWLARANVTDSKLGPDMPHWYFRVSGCREGKRCAPVASDYIFDELPFYQPKQNSLYVKEQNWQRGVFCRFGMKGVLVENHFDGERNFLTVLGGERRYILAHPNQCDKMALFPPGHPSARHSAVDWSDPDLEAFPEFAAARGNEVVLQAGDSLFVPSLWFHTIISLSLNMQCNTRSGLDPKYFKDVEKCGYDVM